jgi:hypothetical protein
VSDARGSFGSARYGAAWCSLVAVASHHPGRPKVVAAILGMMTALSAVTLAGSGYVTAPTGSQVTLALVGSALAGCLAMWAGWPTGVRLQKKARGVQVRTSLAVAQYGPSPVVTPDGLAQLVR